MAPTKSTASKDQDSDSPSSEKWISFSEAIDILGEPRSTLPTLRRTMKKYGVKRMPLTTNKTLYARADVLALRATLDKERAELMTFKEAWMYLGTTKDGIARMVKAGTIAPVTNCLGRKAFYKKDLAPLLARLKALKQCYGLSELVERLGKDGLVVDFRMLFYYLRKQDKVKPLKTFGGHNVYAKKDYPAIRRMVKKRIG